jgi:hypothetical protein
LEQQQQQQLSVTGTTVSSTIGLQQRVMWQVL